MDQLYHIFHSTNQCPKAAEAVISVAEALQNACLQSARNTAPLKTSTKALGEWAEGGHLTRLRSLVLSITLRPDGDAERRSFWALVLVNGFSPYGQPAPLHQCLFRPEKSEQTGLTWDPESDGVVVAWAGRRRLIDNQRVASASSSSALSSMDGRT